MGEKLSEETGTQSVTRVEKVSSTTISVSFWVARDYTGSFEDVRRYRYYFLRISCLSQTPKQIFRRITIKYPMYLYTNKK